MQTPEELIQFWKLLAICSFIFSSLMFLAILLLFFIRYNLGKMDGAIAFAEYMGKDGGFVEKHHIHKKFKHFITKSFPSHDREVIEELSFGLLDPKAE